MIKILVVDDDTTFCIMLKNWLGKRGFEAEAAFSCKEAIKKLEKEVFDVVLSDLRLPDKDGIELLHNVKERRPETQFILMTGYADIQTAVTAIKAGAFDYVSKPVIPDEILKKLQEALKLEKTEGGKPAKVKATENTITYIKGVSQGADRLYEYIRLVGPTMMSVLINGESGTGKEYIARLIHSMSNRKDGPFVAVDCGAVPKDLAAGEFFGHLKGAFTGAVTDKEGYFVTASGGTIFLDEIGNLPYDVQVQLLRALEERKVHPVGGNKDIPVDVRIISATNENLKEAVATGKFREDLYHRLNEFSIQAIPLRERKEDILIFANNFLDKANEELGKKVVGFAPEVLELFRSYPWPGNLREMRNMIKRATLLCPTDLITKECLPPEMDEVVSKQEKTYVNRREMEKELIRDALQKCHNNKSEAARMLQIDRKTLYNKLKAYGLDME